MEEIWKPAIEKYEISNLGNLRKGDKIIGGSINNRGYRYLQLQREGKRLNYLFHQLVAKAFIGERPHKYDTDHINRDKLDNRLENLRYITHQENAFNTDRYKNGAKPPSKWTGVRRRKGTGQLIKRPCGTWRAIIEINKTKHDKSFPTKEDAEAFLSNIIIENAP